MKQLILLFGLITFLSACQNTKKDNATTSDHNSIQKPEIDYPDDLDKVFDKHGTIAQWKKMKTLSYELVNEKGNEKQIIDLVERREVIKSPTFTSGYDGKDYWVEADSTYKGNAKFYTNLIFYFYAMPFVLSDEGINYTLADPLTFEGIEYPGYKISYGDGIGLSSKDEYYIHYNAETNEMAWLGYTVTFHSGESSKKISWIRYNDWKSFNGLKLPNSMTWYTVEDGKITTPKKVRSFTNVNISEQASEPSIFSKTTGARVVE